MTPITEILDPGNVKLALESDSELAAVDEVLGLLQDDPQVRDFSVLGQAVHERQAASIVENGCGICIAHGRTESISSLVMAAGRSLPGLPVSGCKGSVKLFFVAGIPGAFNAEYLRIVGAIARICRDRHQLDRLLAAKTTSQFVQILGAGELKL